MTDTIRRKLIELARSKATWSYAQLNEQLDLKLDFKNKYDRGLMSEWLELISKHEFEKGRPILSSLIIPRNQEKAQADDFYKLCEQLYGTPWRDLKADKNFELEKIQECFSFWKDHENFSKYGPDY
jgi:hypothetical protein